MQLFELVVALLIGAAVLTTVSRRIGAPYPVVLAIAGACLAVLPMGDISARLDPQLALALFVAPVLLDAAFDTSPRDLRANWKPVTSLVLFCVILTVAAVAVVARWLVPDMPWAVAIAIGAIVSPPDASAATSILRLVAPPHRILVILEGESLLNDASALLIYRAAVAAALGASWSPWQAIPLLLLSALGGVALGAALGWVFPRLTRAIDDIPVHVVLQFVGTFAVWLIAEAIGVSPILTVVAYAMVIAQSRVGGLGAENRRTSFAVWDVAVYVLNALAFILVGLQLQPILRDAHEKGWLYLRFGLAILATVILVRAAWVTLYTRGVLLHGKLTRQEEPTEAGGGPSWQSSLVVSWCGMRGVVTLATALALPYGENGTHAFPQRDLVVATAFVVVLGSLVLQGLTLGPLLRWLHLSDDGHAEREEKVARQDAVKAAVAMLKHRKEPESDLLQREYAIRQREETTDESVDPDVIGELRMAAIGAERRAIERLRRNRTIGDTVFRMLEEELDFAEAHAVHRKQALADLGPLDEAPEHKDEA